MHGAPSVVLPEGTGDQVVLAVTGHVAQREAAPEGVLRLHPPAWQVALVVRAAAGGRGSLRAAGQHGDRACIDHGPDVLAVGAHGQVVEAVAVGVAGGQRAPPRVVALVRAGHARTGLRERRAGTQSLGRAEEHLHQADGARTGQRLPGDADREVAVGVGVEVSDRQGSAEAVARLGASRHARAGLGEQHGRPLAAEEHGHAAGAHRLADVLARRAHRHVRAPVTIEVDDRPWLRGRRGDGCQREP
ncbi:MAG: hypothetical protein M3P96_03775 [Actinomycetota bacterium]|nr:hypothetical protein [Actinomycetota bacterium]